ncbi:glycosyltransferase family 2 protein [Geodermatophilus sp. SYSU D01119]
MSGATVIVRAKDKADTIGSTLRALRAQTVVPEILVVDSGSTDGTVDIARQWADQVLHLEPADFSFGGALNVGAEAASGDVHFALSAHCVPDRTDWVERSLALYDEDARVAATNQASRTPAGLPIATTYHQTVDDVCRSPLWGFSNHASSWRADVWREFPFRIDLPACEDKEWSWRVLASGRTIAYSPALAVPSVHRRQQGLRTLHRRVAGEAQALTALGATRPLTITGAVSAWWSSFSLEGNRPRFVRRMNPHRVVELAGAWSGSRAAEHLRGPRTFPSGCSGPRPMYLPWASAEPDG